MQKEHTWEKLWFHMRSLEKIIEMKHTWSVSLFVHLAVGDDKDGDISDSLQQQPSEEHITPTDSIHQLGFMSKFIELQVRIEDWCKAGAPKSTPSSCSLMQVDPSFVLKVGVSGCRWLHIVSFSCIMAVAAMENKDQPAACCKGLGPILALIPYWMWMW